MKDLVVGVGYSEWGIDGKCFVAWAQINRLGGYYSWSGPIVVF